MRLSKLFALTLFGVLSSCGAARDAEIRTSLDDGEQQAFRSVPGVIRVTLRTGQRLQPQTTLRIESGELTQTQVPAAPKPESSWRVFGGATMLPVVSPGQKFAGPYAFSHDGKFVAASAVAVTQTEPAQRLAIVDLNTHSVIGEVTGPEGTFVHGVAWSPNDQFVAAVFMRPERGKISAIASVSGHPPGSATYFLDVLTRHAKQVVRIDLAKRLPDSVGELSWD
jgi:hypothetical protein